MSASNQTPLELGPKVKVPRRTPFICRQRVRKFLLEHAKQTRAHKFTRVSHATLSQINATVRLQLEGLVHRLPSKGQTI